MSHERVGHNKIVLHSRHVKLFHNGFQQRLGGFATRVIRVKQIVDMGDRDKGEPTIELIETESLFQSTLMDSKFVRKSVSEVLIPGATCVASSANTSSCHAHFSRFTSLCWLPFWHHEQEQPFSSSCLQVCRSGIRRTTTPMFLCCARKNQEKTVTTARSRVRTHH